LAFTSLLQDHILTILVIDIGVSLEQAVAGLDLNLAGISLASQIELDHWDAEKLGVGAHVSWHWHFSILARVRLGEALQALWRISDRSDWNVFDYQVCKFIIRLSMLWTKVDVKVNLLPSWNLTLSWLDSVMSIFIFKGNLLRILLFVNAPMEGNQNR
jgi:hypothetical protein